MGENDLAIGVLPLASAGDKIAGRTRSLVRIVNHRLRKQWTRPYCGGRAVSGMYEDDCASFIKLGPDGRKVTVSQVFAVIGAEERYTIALKHIKGILDLRNGAWGVSETR